MLLTPWNFFRLPDGAGEGDAITLASATYTESLSGGNDAHMASDGFIREHAMDTASVRCKMLEACHYHWGCVVIGHPEQ